jgi:hypothetical protein
MNAQSRSWIYLKQFNRLKIRRSWVLFCIPLVGRWTQDLLQVKVIGSGVLPGDCLASEDEAKIFLCGPTRLIVDGQSLHPEAPFFIQSCDGSTFGK